MRLALCVFAIHALAAWHVAVGSRSLILCLVRLIAVSSHGGAAPIFRRCDYQRADRLVFRVRIGVLRLRHMEGRAAKEDHGHMAIHRSDEHRGGWFRSLLGCVAIAVAFVASG